MSPALALPADTPFRLVPLLRETLQSKGVEVHPSQLAELLRGPHPLEGVARCASAHGLSPRLRRLGAGDAAFVDIGDLVAFADGEVARVIASLPGGALVERADGSRVRLAGDPRRAPIATLTLGSAPTPHAEDERAPSGLLARLVRDVLDRPRAARAIVLTTFLSVLVLLGGLGASVLTRMALAGALTDHAPRTLHVLVAGVLLTGVHLAYVSALRRRALRYLGVRLGGEASVAVVDHMLRLPYARLARLEVGAATQAAASAGAAAGALTALFPQLLDAILGLGWLAYAMSIDRTSGALAAVAGALVLLIGAAAGHRELGLRRALLGRSRATQQRLYETLAAVETVKVDAGEERMTVRWSEALVREQKAALDLRVHGGTVSSVLAALDTLVFAGVLLLVARRCLAGEADVADVTVAVQTTACFMASAQALGRLPALVSALRGDVERCDEVLAERLAKAPGRAAGRVDARVPALVLRDVWFRYDDASPWVLSGLDLVVRAGERHTLRWPSGAGKSTLLRLLSGLLAPTRGDVLVFGADAREARRRIAYVPQSAALFPGSLLENLQLLSRCEDGARLVEAARRTGLLELVSGWGMGLDTVISAGGANLSSGQRQLVLLTAALASEAPIVLLDEALANMDASMRARATGHDLFAGRTVIEVTHA